MWCKVGDLEAEFCGIVNLILRTPRWQLAPWRGATASEHCLITRQCVVGVAITGATMLPWQQQCNMSASGRLVQPTIHSILGRLS
jgi:hypothetical protein